LYKTGFVLLLMSGDGGFGDRIWLRGVLEAVTIDDLDACLRSRTAAVH
jgi:hypothetical protein